MRIIHKQRISDIHNLMLLDKHIMFNIKLYTGIILEGIVYNLDINFQIKI